MPKVFVISTNGIDGGASIHIETLTANLKSDFEFIFVFGSDGGVVNRLINSGFTCYIIKGLGSHFNPFNDILAVTELLRLVNLHKPKLLHLHSSKAGIVGRIVGFLSSTPVVFTIHGWGWRGMSFVKRNIVFYVERFFSLLPNQYFIYVSDSVKHEAHQLLKIKKEKGCVILNGTEDFKLDINKNDVFTIIMPARVSDAKDHITLVKAFELLSFNSLLILCGHGTSDINFKSKLISYAPKRNKSILFLGSQSSSRMKFLLNQSHVFALISNFEALPLSIIEAMSSSLPIIASAVGGVSELLKDGENGFLINKNDINQIVKAICELRNSNLRELMGHKSRSIYLSNFSASKMCELTKEVYIKNILA